MSKFSGNKMVRSKRKTITPTLGAQVIHRSDRLCCVCEKRGRQIHHIDGNPANNDFFNLAYLCHNCHDEAETKSRMSRGLSPKTILKYRDSLYQKIDNKRAARKLAFATPIQKFDTEILLNTVKDAIIILELEKIKEEYVECEKPNRGRILSKVNRYIDHNNLRIAYAVFELLDFVADIAHRETESVVSQIEGVMINFFPYSKNPKDKKKITELGFSCCEIANTLVYDALIKYDDFITAMHGLTILKYIYKRAAVMKLASLKVKVLESYSELESHLAGREKPELKNGLQLLGCFKKDIERGTLAWPPLPENLMVLVERNKVDSNNK